MVVLFHIVPVLSLFLLLKLTVFFPGFSVHLLRLVIAKHFVSTSDFAILAIPSSSFRLHVFALCQVRDLVALTFACDGMSTKDSFAGMRGRKDENIEKAGSNEPETKEERAI